jgi:hypothetical protein
VHLFEEAVSEGRFSAESATLYAYGIYLMNGGTPEGFDTLTEDDIQILLTSYTGTMARQNKTLFKMLKAFFGGDD